MNRIPSEKDSRALGMSRDHRILDSDFVECLLIVLLPGEDTTRKDHRIPSVRDHRALEKSEDHRILDSELDECLLIVLLPGEDTARKDHCILSENKDHRPLGEKGYSALESVCE